ncbi:hypothetical protein DIPPA_25723 [Diplonema papillatum]|nr:hypothetical protein DIPPA_25723 [Diplonema papillatum]
MVSLFSETTPYVTIGDDYDKKAPVDPRNVGLKCFVTNPGKKGNMPNVLFEWSLGGFKSLHEGDPYIAPGQNNKGDSQEITRKFVGSGPFRYTNPMKKSTGLGGFDGCFQGYVPHETDFDVIKKGERPKRPEAGLRNIVTNPPKKGTFGVPGTLLSNSFGGVNADWKGLEYICDPFDTAQKAEQKQRALAASLLAEKAPFKVGSKSKQYFDESTNVCSIFLARLLSFVPSLIYYRIFTFSTCSNNVVWTRGIPQRRVKNDQSCCSEEIAAKPFQGAPGFAFRSRKALEFDP